MPIGSPNWRPQGISRWSSECEAIVLCPQNAAAVGLQKFSVGDFNVNSVRTGQPTRICRLSHLTSRPEHPPPTDTTAALLRLTGSRRHNQRKASEGDQQKLRRSSDHKSTLQDPHRSALCNASMQAGTRIDELEDPG